MAACGSGVEVVAVNSSSNGSGIVFLELLALVFITLKLVGVIQWSWWWVLSPIWAPAVVFAILFGLFWVRTKIKR